MNATDKVRKALVLEFRQISVERLERMTTAWVALETGAARAAEHCSLILRELHTLKGEAKLMGFSVVSGLAHHLEELIVTLERNAFRRAGDIGDFVLRVTDALGKLIQGEPGDDKPGEIAELEARLVAATNIVTGADERAPAAPVELTPVGAPEPIGRDAFVRVDVAIAHHLAEEASEAVITHARYQHAVSNLRTCSEELGTYMHRAARLSPGLWTAIAAIHSRLVTIVDQLADDVHGGDLVARALELDTRRLRLVPVAGLFRTHLRAVRELARELGKAAALQIVDAGVAVDREVVERLGAPLLHLLRNCVDHGLENPTDRRLSGKPETGQITLSAERVGGEVVMIVEDDGAGVDREAVRKRAIARGLIGPTELLDDQAVLGLLFTPGFSTRREATETSGRGIGLDVVKRQVESLGGSVRMSSQPGKGTRFEVRVPVSVALTRAVIVEENGQRFAVPHAAVEAVIGIDADSIEVLHRQRYISFRGDRIPLIELVTALDLAGHQAAARHPRALVLRHEGQCVAILVEGWRGDAEVVVKPLGTIVGSRVVIGACTLEGGDVALVLSPSELLTRALGEGPRIRTAAPAPKHADQRILLVEDSAITRTMIAQLLRMLGYQVAEAEDGERALRVLEDFHADGVITDVEMPVLDGIGLIRRLRADARWRGVPVVVLSTRGSTEDKQRAVGAGANAYLVKTEFSEAALRDVLSRHVGRAS